MYTTLVTFATNKKEPISSFVCILKLKFKFHGSVCKKAKIAKP